MSAPRWSASNPDDAPLCKARNPNEECSRGPERTKGMCRKHYLRQIKHGSTAKRTADSTTCASDGCGKQFRPRSSQHRYCSPVCRDARYRDQYLSGPSLTVGLASGTVGAISELVAGADLLRQGFEVFRALSPSCSCDLIALRDGESLRIEVRTGMRSRVTGHISYPRKDSDENDHYCIVLREGDEIIYEPPLPARPDQAERLRLAG